MHNLPHLLITSLIACCTPCLTLQVWVYAEVADRPGGTVYASGRALYVTPKQAAAADGH